MYYTIMNTHMCDIILVGDEEGIKHLHLDTSKGKREFNIDSQWIFDNEFFIDAINQIEEFFLGKRAIFDIKIAPEGTDYQKKVWNELSKIPFGEIYTYKKVATNLNNPKASRAVGMANSKNPIPLIVPCHRVIGANGKLVGFAHGLEIKEKLLNFEKMINVYNLLLNHYKTRKWWPANSDYEMMIGAILTQNTTWKNVEKAISNLKDVLNPIDILKMDNDVLAEYIRPSGYYNQKTLKLKALTRWYEKYKFDIEEAKKKDGVTLRHELLEIKGVGPETADCILTYALDKPYFIIDTYTRRLFERVGFIVPEDYDDFRLMIENSIVKDTYLYKEYHSLIVEHSKQYCMKTPNCQGCPIYDYCERDI